MDVAAAVIANLKVRELGDDQGGLPNLNIPLSRKDQNEATAHGLNINYIDLPDKDATTLNTSEGRQTALSNRMTRKLKSGDTLDLPTPVMNNG